MKATVNVLLLTLMLLSGPLLALINLSGTKRHITVQIRHEQGVVIIDSKKVRVPYTMQETAIPAHTDGIIDYLFLGNYGLCLVSAFSQLIMSLMLIFIFYVNTIESRLCIYRPMALKTLLLTIPAFILSEICSNYVNQNWIIDIKNGINGNSNLFGLNTTPLNISTWSLHLNYQPNATLFIIPLIATFVLIVNAKKTEETDNYTLDGETP